MNKNARNNKHKAPAPQPQKDAPKRRFTWRLPSCLLFTIVVWLWAAGYYGSVFQTSYEYSFWSTDSRTMQFFLCQSYAPLRYVGRALLTLFHNPWLGGALLAFLLGSGSVLTGYVLRLPTRWRALQYVPALTYMAVLTFYGLDFFFEAETGYILGIPFCVYLLLGVAALVMGCASHRPLPPLWKAPKEESLSANWVQTLVVVLGVAAIIGMDQWQRPYVRTICRMIVAHNSQDWAEVQRVARANAEQSNRIMATYYAAALVHTDQIGSRVYDIRLEYDTLYLHGMDGRLNNGINMYLQEGNYHAGLAQTAYHACMEEMVMTGPSVRLLKLMTKCALMRNEWELARKYLRILADVPFEGDFCKKYGRMVRHPELVNADPEMALLRELEPVMDSFENHHQNPTFMGYNLNLTMARSMAAWNNSTAVCLYTKLMPQFTSRLEPYRGGSLPDNFADGALLASRKYPEIMEAFPNLKWRATQLDAYTQSVQPYMQDRPKYGPLLFPSQKGYYPHYYFFGNLRATKAGYTGEPEKETSVN